MSTSTGAGLSEQFSGTDNFSGVVTQTGSLKQTLVEQGSVGTKGLSLDCYVLNATSSGVYSGATTASSTQAGSGSSKLTSSTPSTVGAGLITVTSASQFRFSGASASATTGSGGFSQGSYTAGQFAKGSFALSSVVYRLSGSDSYSGTGSDNSVSSGSTATTVRASIVAALGGGTQLQLYTSTATTTYGSSAQDSYSQSGSDSYSSAQVGAFSKGSFAFAQALYQASSRQSSQMQASGSDSFSLASVASGSTLSTQGSIASFAGLGTTSVPGTFIVSGQSVSAQKGSDCWSLSSTALASSSMYESGRYGAGSFNLSSVNLVQSSSDCWASSFRQNASGTSNYTLTSSGLSTDPTAGGCYVSTSKGLATGSSSSSGRQSGTDSSSLSQLGGFAGGGFLFGSVVFQAGSTQSSTGSMAGGSVSSGTVASSYLARWVQPINYAATYRTGVGVTTSTQSGQSNYSQNASESFSLSSVSSGSTSVYQAGRFSLGSYALSSVSYHERDSSQGTLHAGQAAADSGSNSWAGQSTSNGNWAAFLSVGSGQTSTGSNYRGTFQDSLSSSTSLGSTSSVSLTERGVFGNGCYAFGCWVYDQSGSQQSSTAAVLKNRLQGSGSDSTTFSQQQSWGTPSNLVTLTIWGSSSDSYASSGSQMLSLLSSASSRSSLHEAGRYALGSYSLSSVNYASSGQGTLVQTQSTVSLSSGQYSSDTHSSNLQSSVASTAPLGLNTRKAQSSVQTSTGNFSAGSVATVSQTSTDSSSMSQLGSDNSADSFRFSGVVYQSTAASSGRQTGLSSYNWAGTVASSLVSSSLGSGLIPNDSMAFYRQSGAAGSSAYQSGALSTSSVEVVTSRNSLLEQGNYGPGGYAYSSVVLGSSSSDSSTVWQSSRTLQSGTNWANNSSSVTMQRPTGLGTALLGTRTSAQGTSASTSNRFRTSSTSTTTSSALSSSSLSQRGNYGNGSYAFSSQVYQTRTASQVGYQERDSANFTGTFLTSTRFNANNTSILYPGQTTSVLNLNGWSQGQGHGGQQYGSTVTTVVDNKLETSTLYQADSGSSSSSVAFRQSAVETSTVSNTATTTQPGSNSTLNSTGWSLYVGTQSSLPTGSSAQGTVSGQTFVQTTQQSSTLNTVNRNSLTQLGQQSNGGYSFGSVVYQGSQSGSRTSTVLGVQSYTQGNSSSQTLWSSNQGLGTLSRGQQTSSRRSGHDTLTSTDVQTSSSNDYLAGSYANGSQGYSLNSVNYQTRSSDSSQVVRQGGFSEVGAQSNQSSTAYSTLGIYAAQTSTQTNKTYVLVNSSVQTLVSQSSASLSERGKYGQGSFALSSVVLSETGSSTTTTLTASTNNSTQVTVKGTSRQATSAPLASPLCRAAPAP